MEEQLVISGTVDNIIYYNSENSYAVFSLVFDEPKVLSEGGDEEEEIICVGTVANINIGESIKVIGSMIKHPSYGEQLKIEFYEKMMPSSEKGIEKYLASGVIKGIGKSYAKKIVEKFGDKTFEVMEKTPEKLAQIKGISLNRAIQIGNVFYEQTELRRVMLYLQDFNISPTYAVKIYKHYKEKTIQTIQTDPYVLAEDIYGIGFRTADEIAEKVGISKESDFRIKAGIKYVLSNNSANGHVYLPADELTTQSAALLEIAPETVENGIDNLLIERKVCSERTENGLIIFLSSYYYAESYVAKKLIELASVDLHNAGNYEKKIKKIEEEENITLAAQQREAVKQAMKNGVMVITGGPGTGKTTTINTIIKLLDEENYEIQLAAPTGRAAKRMTETTGRPAATIHRLLGINFLAEDSKKQTFEKNEDCPIEADVVIIDESSMVDIILMHHLLKAIAIGTRLIIVGDADQLPSVGAGNVLRDIIASERIKVVRLTEIFRQARESSIIMNAHRINKGEYPVLNEPNKDFFFVKRYNIDDVAETIRELITSRLPKFAKCEPSEIQVLTPMRKSQIGVINLNPFLREAMNPSSPYKAEKEYRGTVFREGDKVMQIKNNYNITWEIYENGKYVDDGTGVFNGDDGIIKRINDDEEYIEVVYDDNKHVKYDYTQLDELELSYAVTIHKSQGSEYRVVIIPIHSGPAMLLSRNLLYTAVTRAKELAVIVGIPETLERMVDNNREVNRYTYLKERIRNLYEYMR
ncbi:MAG: ATP-dependent RecD-like DNA helicase [Firmicutes bacterium]|nr:ATP-dependent RecD-like DNA helicase [Bacillota bacterium]